MLKSTRNIKDEVGKFILEEFLPKGYVLNDDVSLFDSGIIDSLGVIKLIAFIEEKFKIIINPSEVRIENFNTIDKITDIISKKISR
jgi:acyl carrier protein